MNSCHVLFPVALKHARELCYDLNVGCVSETQGFHLCIKPNSLEVLALRMVEELLEDFASVLEVCFSLPKVV